MFYLIDKPIGLTSFDVVRHIKKVLGTRRVGHAGTLDPLASGCLLIATDKNTKLLPLIEGSDKTYVFTIAIDGTTVSLDLDTPIVPHDTSAIVDRTPEELCNFILSQTSQLPPKYSALHVDGKRAYQRIRDGEDFALQIRPITVHSVYIRQISLPYITIELRISSGGYVRSFAPIVGQFFGVDGGYITELKRTTIHTPQYDLHIGESIPFKDFSPEKNIPRGELFPDIISYKVDANTAQALKEGRIIPKIEGITGLIGQKYFLESDELFCSFVQFGEDGFVILRNDV